VQTISNANIEQLRYVKLSGSIIDRYIYIEERRLDVG
jgi:hypothetical protein